MRKQIHVYEEEYGEYDRYFDISSHESKDELALSIRKKFKLQPKSANKLSEKLWKIYMLTAGEPVIPLFVGTDKPQEKGKVYVK